MDENAEEWLATEDPTNGDLPVTDFMGSTKDLSQSVEPEETDGTEVEDVPEETDGTEAADAPEETDGDEESAE